MEVKNNILGCFIKIGFDPNLTEQDFNNLDRESTPYIFGEKGISKKLKKLNYRDYGEDLELALFKFYIKPTLLELQSIKEIESYRKKEKSIGIPIIVNDENFFSKTEEDRYDFLKESIFQKLELLTEVVKKKKLDTDIEKLEEDLRKIL